MEQNNFKDRIKMAEENTIESVKEEEAINNIINKN